MRRDARGRAWETYFVTTARLTNAIEAELKAKCHVTQPEYNVLLQVARAGDEGIRPSALADTHCKSACLSRIRGAYDVRG